MVKVYGDRLEISNNGGFIAGITPENILHHPPAARNLLMVEALTRLRLVNRSNLGISRMFSALLMEGKEAPIIREAGDSVTVTFFNRELNPAFRLFVAEESGKGRILNVDELILLQYLLRHPEVDTAKASWLCQQDELITRECLSAMEQSGYVEHGGAGRGAFWNIHPNLYDKLSGGQIADRHSRIDWEAAKTRILSILKEHKRRGKAGLSSQEIRQITRFSRSRAHRLMTELRMENPQINPPRKGRYARYELG